jgi:hypothetical protein
MIKEEKIMLENPFDILILFLIATFSIAIGALIVIIIQRDKRINAQLESNSEKQKHKETSKPELPKEDMDKFMEFDKIVDDMIVQDNGNRFVMVLKCQGINYDLMSEPEMLSVEEGFSSFLNTLKYPIQLYVQARSLNLEESINAYRNRINELHDSYVQYESNSSQAKKAGRLSPKDKAAIDFELSKRQSLLEYGADIVNYIEKMSMNKNILQRKYYIVVAYHTSELGLATSFTKEEAHDLAYSELYTRCRSISSALTSCGVESSILKTEELAELLYVAYNKDDADVFNLRKALQNGFYRLYSTAPDVLEKKQEMLDNAVKEQAISEAELALQKAMAAAKELNGGLTYEQKMNDASKAQAMQIILDNSDQFEESVVDMALDDLNSQMINPVITDEEIEDEDVIEEETKE